MKNKKVNEKLNLLKKDLKFIMGGITQSAFLYKNDLVILPNRFCSDLFGPFWKNHIKFVSKTTLQKLGYKVIKDALVKKEKRIAEIYGKTITAIWYEFIWSPNESKIKNQLEAEKQRILQKFQQKVAKIQQKYEEVKITGKQKEEIIKKFSLSIWIERGYDIEAYKAKRVIITIGSGAGTCFSYSEDIIKANNVKIIKKYPEEHWESGMASKGSVDILYEIQKEGYIITKKTYDDILGRKKKIITVYINSGE